MATHPTKPRDLLKVHPATAREAVACERYEAVRTGPDSPERRAAEREFEAMVRARGSIAALGRLYSWNAGEGALYRMRFVLFNKDNQKRPTGSPARGGSRDRARLGRPTYERD